MDIQKAGFLEGIISIILNTLLFIFKYWIGLMTGSIALMADAWHTLSDTLSSLVVLAATKFSAKPADDEHPFGHGRYELIGAVMIGILLGLVALNFIIESITKFFDQEVTLFGPPAIIVTIISIVVKEGMAQYAFWLGKKSGSDAITADGWHHRSDALSSVVILAGILIGSYLWWIDPLLGILVALLITKATYEIVKKPLNHLIGENLDPRLVDDIKRLAESIGIDGEQLHHLHIHVYGHHRELTFHIRLNPDLTLLEAHQKTTELEKLIREKFEIESTIHTEPYFK